MFDPVRLEDVENRVREARALGGSTPVLIGFDANGIQELVMASSRPVAMRGASDMVRDFDDECRKARGSIFSGGGRGLRLAAEADVEAVERELVERYRRTTHGGALAVAHAPLEKDDEQGSLALLRLRLAIAKDAAPPPEVPVPTSRADQCADCRIRRATKASRRPDHGDERVCERCSSAVERGGRGARAAHEAGFTLEDLAKEGRVAVVSADGNNMGALFAGLRTLVATALCSALVDEIFRASHSAALDRSRSTTHVAPVTGGDDIRVLLPPPHLLDYVTELATEVEARSEAAAGRFGGRLEEPSVRALSRLGIGIGAVIAPHHYPASRLVGYAHDLERSAKRLCREGATRSAFDFALLSSGDEEIQSDRQPHALPGASWATKRTHARALRSLPKRQMSALFRRREGWGDEEHRNLFRYQVARSRDWQRWCDAIGIDWRDRAELDAHMPSQTTVALSSLEQRREEAAP